MTYHTEAGTVEDIMAQYLRKMSPDDIRAATGKSPDHFYKVKNPNNSLSIHFLDAVALDAKSMELGREAHFLTLFKTLTQSTAFDAKVSARGTYGLSLGSLYGQLCTVMLQHDKDGHLDAAELDEEIRIADALVEKVQQAASNLHALRVQAKSINIVKVG